MVDPVVFRARLVFWISIGVMFIVGAGGLILANAWPWGLAQRFTEAFSTALLVAAFLALSVDISLKTQLLRDAFSAAYQYILPRELKNEIPKLMKFDFVAERHNWTVAIEKHDEETVRVTTSIERRLKNVTSGTRNAVGLYQTFDFGFKQGKSEILEYRAKTEDGRTIDAENAKLVAPHSIEARIKGDLSVPPGKQITLHGKAVQYRRYIDIMFETFLYPAVNPEINVIIPDEFEFEVQFGTEGEGKEKDQYMNRFRLTGAYIPGQFMLVRWWPKSPFGE
jgi:hypothetical protein